MVCLLLLDRHFPRSPRSFFILVLPPWPSPQVIPSFPLLLLSPQHPLLHYIDFELRANECLDPFLPCQSQAQQFPLALDVNVKIEKRATLALRSYPFRQLGKRNLRRAELEFVTLRGFEDFLAPGDEFFAQLFVPRPLVGSQRFSVAVKLALYRGCLSFGPHSDR